ncbi:hypothetical protein ACVW1A_000341 [Bradyrhizobium sp. LB1.3]
MTNQIFLSEFKSSTDLRSIVDCDIHPVPRSRDDVLAFLSERWRSHAETYGIHTREPFSDMIAYRACRPLSVGSMLGPRAGDLPEAT